MSEETVLVIVAHPDDEVLGCGGTIARLAEQGCRVGVWAIGTGVGARNKSDEARRVIYPEIDRRLVNFKDATQILGVEGTVQGGNPPPDNAFDTVPLLDLVQRVEEVLGYFGSDVVYTHHYGDLNIDHQTVARAVVTAVRPYPGQRVKRVYAFEVPGSTEWNPLTSPFRPTVFVPLTDGQARKKFDAWSCYESEAKGAPHPRGMIDTLLKLRGSQCGHLRAEAFELIREIR